MKRPQLKSITRKIRKKVKARQVGRMLIIILCIEATLQIISFGRFIYYRNKAVENQYNKYWYYRDPRYKFWVDNVNKVKSFYDPLLGWTSSIENFDGVTSTSDGLRITVESKGEKKDLKSVYFFGGSTMWGTIVRDEETIPSLINKKMSGKNKDYNIVNQGQIGFSNSQELAYLTKLLKEGVVGDYLVFYDGCNELGPRFSQGHFQTVYFEDSIRKLVGNIYALDTTNAVENKSLINTQLIKNVLGFASKYIKVIHYPLQVVNVIRGESLLKTGVLPTVQVDDSNIEEYSTIIADNYSRNAQFIDKLSKIYGFKYILLWQPLLVTKAEYSPDEQLFVPDKFTELKSVYRKSGEKILNSGTKHYYNISEALDLFGNKNVYFDSCHITPEGNEEIAKKILEIMDKEWKL